MKRSALFVLSTLLVAGGAMVESACTQAQIRSLEPGLKLVGAAAEIATLVQAHCDDDDEAPECLAQCMGAVRHAGDGGAETSPAAANDGTGGG